VPDAPADAPTRESIELRTLVFLPPAGCSASPSGTLFASQSAAYDALTPAFKTFLDGLTATHSGDRSYRRTNRLLGIDDRDRVFPTAVHPVVRTHPVTRRKALFVNGNFTLHINELSAEESRAVLDFLYAHSTKPAFQVRFSWQAHSIAFWDNRAVQHIAMWDYFPQVRSGYRVTIKGDRPY
jgi:taurine dioxygenase